MLTTILNLDRGLYVWAVPTSETCISLQVLPYAFPEEDFPIKWEGSSDFHSTVLYCRDISPNPDKRTADRVVGSSLEGYPVEAVPQLWEVPGGALLIVLTFRHPSMESINHGLVRSGFPHSFPQYRPHVTLGKFVRPVGKRERFSLLASARKVWAETQATLQFEPRVRWSAAC